MALQDHAKRVDMFAVPVGMIEVDPAFNPRDMRAPDTVAHVEALKESIKARGFDPDRPLLGRYQAEKFILTDGHCRWAAVTALLQDGAEIISVPCRTEPRGTSEADRLLLTLRDPGRPLTQLEQASAIKRLMSFGWDEAAVAAKLGKSRAWVAGCLDLAEAPEPIRQAVADSVISASEATKLVREDAAPVETLEKAKEAAKAEGRERVRPRDVAKVQQPKATKLTPEQKAIKRFLMDWEPWRARHSAMDGLDKAVEGLRAVLPADEGE